MRMIPSLALMLICTQVSIAAQPTAFDQLLSAQTALCPKDCQKAKPECCPVCLEGPRGKKGKKGPKGQMGEIGYKGPSLEINNFLTTTTTQYLLLPKGSYITFTPPFFSTTGFESGRPNGLALIESAPGSGIFDQIKLPSESTATFYSVTLGVSIWGDKGDFAIELNGTVLPYTDLAISAISPLTLISRTNIIVNPPNTVGRLKFQYLVPSMLSIISEVGLFSGYVTVVKLNNLGNN